MFDLLDHFSGSVNSVQITIDNASADDAEMIAGVHYHSWNSVHANSLSGKNLEDRILFWQQRLKTSEDGHNVLVLRLNNRNYCFLWVYRNW